MWGKVWDVWKLWGKVRGVRKSEKCEKQWLMSEKSVNSEEKLYVSEKVRHARKSERSVRKSEKCEKKWDMREKFKKLEIYEEK